MIRPFHSFKIKPQEGIEGVNANHYDLFLDDQPLKGVEYVKVMMGVDEVPVVMLMMMVSEVDLEAVYGRIEVEKDEQEEAEQSPYCLR